MYFWGNILRVYYGLIFLIVAKIIYVALQERFGK